MAKRFQAVDEEKEVAAGEALQNIASSRRETSIPFGVRAIESGIEVDGIWVSRSNTPMPESLKSLPNSARSSISSRRSTDITNGTQAGDNVPTVSIEHVDDMEEAFRQTQLSLNRFANGMLTPSERDTVVWRRTASYKPRRASQLRYSSQPDGTDGDAMEADGSPPNYIAHHRQSSQRATIVLDSSSEVVIDSERSSAKESESSLSVNELYTSNTQVKATRGNEMSGRPEFTGKGRASNDSARSLEPVAVTNRTEYRRINLETPPPSAVDPFDTPDDSPTGTSSQKLTNRLPKNEVEALGETQWPLLTTDIDDLEQPTFTPGAIHQNTAHRKINAGFEVLPAGTFNKPPSIEMPRGYKFSLDENATPAQSSRRNSNKLQKRGRSATATSKTSVFVERL
jgi:hypothetical protein